MQRHYITIEWIIHILNNDEHSYSQVISNKWFESWVEQVISLAQAKAEKSGDCHLPQRDNFPFLQAEEYYTDARQWRRQLIKLSIVLPKKVPWNTFLKVHP